MKETGSVPGVTLGAFDTGSGEEILALAKSFAAQISPLPVTTWGVGSFPTNPAQVFLGIVHSAELERLHFQFIRLVRKIGKISPYYDTGEWVPHSTLALRCRAEDIPKIMEICLKYETRLNAKIGSIAVVEIGTAKVLGEFKIGKGVKT